MHSMSISKSLALPSNISLRKMFSKLSIKRFEISPVEFTTTKSDKCPLKSGIYYFLNFFLINHYESNHDF
jgi:hypothetical protein